MMTCQEELEIMRAMAEAGLEARRRQEEDARRRSKEREEQLAGKLEAEKTALAKSWGDYQVTTGRKKKKQNLRENEKPKKRKKTREKLNVRQRDRERGSERAFPEIHLPGYLGATCLMGACLSLP